MDVRARYGTEEPAGTVEDAVPGDVLEVVQVGKPVGGGDLERLDVPHPSFDLSLVPGGAHPVRIHGKPDLPGIG